MTLHRDARALLASWVAPTAGQESLRERYVAHLDAHPDGMSRARTPEHVTAGVLVLDAARSRVLLLARAQSTSDSWPGGGSTRDAADQPSR